MPELEDWVHRKGLPDCRRCGGRMYRERDRHGAYLACLICGAHVNDMPPAPLDRANVDHRDLGAPMRQMERRRAAKRRRYERQKAAAR